MDQMLLLKGLAAALIVGFVTASIQSWVDRFFLVIMLIGLVGIPVTDAITINLIVVSLASAMLVFRQSAVLLSVKPNWLMIIPPAAAGAALGRLIAFSLASDAFNAILGGYAFLAGLRLAFIKPLPEKDTKPHQAWFIPISFVASLLAGLLSAGGKVFQVPLYNAALGRHPKQAYALAVLTVSVAAPVALAMQIGFGGAITSNQILFAGYLFILITGTALLVQRAWNQKLSIIVTRIIAPILVLVGIRFVWMVIIK